MGTTGDAQDAFLVSSPPGLVEPRQLDYLSADTKAASLLSGCEWLLDGTAAAEQAAQPSWRCLDAGHARDCSRCDRGGACGPGVDMC